MLGAGLLHPHVMTCLIDSSPMLWTRAVCIAQELPFTVGWPVSSTEHDQVGALVGLTG